MVHSDTRPTDDQEVMGSIPAGSDNIITWRSIIKYYLQSFSPFRCFKKRSCQFPGERMSFDLAVKVQPNPTFKIQTNLNNQKRDTAESVILSLIMRNNENCDISNFL